MFENVLSMFNESLINSFQFIPLVILLNIFFIVATYTDLKYMKIYNKFNSVMLVTRLISFIFVGFSTDWLLGGLVVFITFLLVGMYNIEDKMAGDIKFGGNIGLWLGFVPSIILVILTVITNLISRVFRGGVKKSEPLAPYFYLSYILLAVYYFYALA